jgi:ADP-ribosylation factor-like protein 1
MLAEGELTGVPLLVLANKQDLPGAIGEAEVSQALGLQAIRDRQWQIFKSSVVTNVGVAEGLDWLISQINTA